MFSLSSCFFRRRFRLQKTFALSLESAFSDDDAVYITEPGSVLMNPESLVSIRKDLDRGVATISVREGSGQLSLEVEGGRDGKLYLSDLFSVSSYFLSYDPKFSKVK